MARRVFAIIATISSDVVVIGRCNCRIVLVVVNVHTGSV
jgi:hypothetical protein